jgi:lipid-binding SYLF domain-containing protein
MTTSFRHVLTILAGAMFAATVGCQTVPDTAEKKATLENHSQSAMANFKNADPSLDNVLANSVGYAIFPTAGKGGLIVGGGYGRGTVYQTNGAMADNTNPNTNRNTNTSMNGMMGTMIGYADITQATIGAQIGGQEFAELIVFQNQKALDRFKNNELQFAADASAVAADKGAAAAAKFKDGVATFIKPEKGLMAGAVIGGQKFNFVPANSSAANMNTSTDMKETKTTQTPSGEYRTETHTETK